MYLHSSVGVITYMAWISNFLEKLLPAKSYGSGGDTVVIDIPAEHYYLELALTMSISLVANAISSSTIRCYVNGRPERNDDYYMLNVSPNRNETSSYFWHKVVGKMVRYGKALVVEAAGHLYCADDYTEEERPVIGNLYSNVSVGNFTFDRTFGIDSAYLIRLDNYRIGSIVQGMYEDFGKILSSAATAFRSGSGKKYKLHIDAIRAGDEEFNKEYEDYVKKQIEDYVKSETAVYPEFDGYDLKRDENNERVPSSDFVSLKQELFSTVASALHIPDTMISGSGVAVSEVMDSFIAFAVNPFADAISEALNKRAGSKNFQEGNYYKVDTGDIRNRDVFDIAVGISNLVSSAVMSINEVRVSIGLNKLPYEWADKHFITRNFIEIENYMMEGDVYEEEILPDNKE